MSTTLTPARVHLLRLPRIRLYTRGRFGGAGASPWRACESERQGPVRRRSVGTPVACALHTHTHTHTHTHSLTHLYACPVYTSTPAPYTLSTPLRLPRIHLLPAPYVYTSPCPVCIPVSLVYTSHLPRMYSCLPCPVCIPVSLSLPRMYPCLTCPVCISVSLARETGSTRQGRQGVRGRQGVQVSDERRQVQSGTKNEKGAHVR